MRRRIAAATLGILGLLGVGLGGAAWSLGLIRPSRIPPQPPPPIRVGEAVAELVRIEPGTILGELPPEGWSHRVIRTRLVLDSGDVDTLPGFARETATKFRTVILADVRPNSSGIHELRRIGVGMMVDRDGQDVVIDGESLDRLGVPATVLDKLVLSRAEEALDRGRLAARTPTFALYDASVEIAEGGRHRSIFLRYAFVLDPEDGALTVAHWPVAEGPSPRTPPATITQLPPALEYRCGLHVQAVRAFGRIPVSWYFAMVDSPPGVLHDAGPALRLIGATDPASPKDSSAMEAAVREGLGMSDPFQGPESRRGRARSSH